MKMKRVFAYLALCLLVLFFTGLVFADTNLSNTTNATQSSTQTTTGTGLDVGDASSAYNCLNNKIANNSNLLLSEAVFSMLALGDKGNLVTIINNNKNSNAACWPKGTCDVKDTAQVALAFNRINKNTSDIESWLMSKSGTPSELSWYLEIDLTNHSSGSCTVKYDNVQGTISIGDDMTASISGGIGSCLSSSGYWARIKDSCIGKVYSVQCDGDFITTLIYQRTGKETYYLSSETHSGGTTEETVGAKCIKSGNVCDYESTLWAAVALQKTGRDISGFVPYLVTLSEENQRYFPSAFLKLIVGGDEQYSKVIALQKQGKYWEINSGQKLFESSLAMLALYGSNANELTSTQNYLLGLRNKDGCWGTIKDTAFLLYTGWPKTISSTPSQSPGCVASGGYCSGSYECLQAGGQVSYSLGCPGVGVCCSINPLTQSCSALNGKVCPIGKTCSGDSAESIDGSCCLGNCEEIVQQSFSCEDTSGQYCRTGCGTDETFGNGDCEGGNVCCTSSTKSGSSLWIWLLLGIILILAIIAYILRDKIRLAWYKYRGKAKISPLTNNKPGMSPPRMVRPLMPPRQMPIQRPMQRVMPLQRSQPTPKKIVGKDSEMEETLKKLREMSK